MGRHRQLRAAKRFRTERQGLAQPVKHMSDDPQRPGKHAEQKRPTSTARKRVSRGPPTDIGPSGDGRW